MTERLPNGVFDQLGGLIWQIGQSSVKELIATAPVPCQLEREFSFGDTHLTVTWGLDQNPITARNDPVWEEATISETEKYKDSDDLKVYFYRALLLDIRRRRKNYETGAYISNGYDITITPEMSRRLMPKSNNAKWREISRNAGGRFGKVEAEKFVAELQTFNERIRQGQ